MKKKEPISLLRYEFSNGNACDVLDTRHSGKYENFSMKWRITVKGKQKYYKTGERFSIDEYEILKTSRSENLRNARKRLETYFNEVIIPSIDDANKSGVFSWERFNSLLGRSDIITVNDAFDTKIKDLRDNNDIGNASIYSNTYNALKRFKHYNTLNKNDKKDFVNLCISRKRVTRGKNKIDPDATITFREITTTFINNFDAFLRETDVSNATIGIYMRTLRALINNKGGDPYLSGDDYPFSKYTIPEGRRKEKALTIKDIRRIEEYAPDKEKPNYDNLILARDMFMFLFYCNGANFGDVCRMQYKDINKYTNEIEFSRKKTSKTLNTIIYVPLLKPMLNILERHGNKEGYLFPFLNDVEPIPNNEHIIKNRIIYSLDTINVALKEIAKDLKLPSDLSTGAARNSYITFLIGDAMISEIAVKKMVGHSTRKNTTAGYVNLTPEKRLMINKNLLP